MKKHGDVVKLVRKPIWSATVRPLDGSADSTPADPGLTEWGYGAYEGRRTVAIRAERPESSRQTPHCR